MHAGNKNSSCSETSSDVVIFCTTNYCALFYWYFYSFSAIVLMIMKESGSMYVKGRYICTYFSSGTHSILEGFLFM